MIGMIKFIFNVILPTDHVGGFDQFNLLAVCDRNQFQINYLSL